MCGEAVRGAYGMRVRWRWRCSARPDSPGLAERLSLWGGMRGAGKGGREATLLPAPAGARSRRFIHDLFFWQARLPRCRERMNACVGRCPAPAALYRQVPSWRPHQRQQQRSLPLAARQRATPAGPRALHPSRVCPLE